MIPQTETDKRVKEAMKYMDRVVDLMALSDTDIKAIIRRNTKKLIDKACTYKSLDISFQFPANDNLEQAVSEILDQTRTQLFNAIYISCYNADYIAHEKEGETHTDKYLLAFLGLHIAGQTIEDRIRVYINQFRSEIEAYIAIGISKNMNPAQILNYYLSWLKNPLSSPLILEAIRKQGYAANLITSRGISYKNKYKSAFNSLLRLQQDSTIRAYNHAISSIWQNNPNIAGWYTVRGSTYPCDICDDNAGVYHTSDDFFYGYHPRCCCIMLPVYVWD